MLPGAVALAAQGLRGADAPRTDSERRKVEKLLKTEYLLNREVERVLAVLTPGNALVVRAQLETGLRVGDVLALQYFQLKNNFWITEQKTGKKRHVGMSTQLIDDIRAYARRVIPRPTLAAAARGEAGAAVCWAFPSPGNWRKHRTRQAVWKDIKRAAAAFRLKVNAGTHSMRKVYAVELMRKYGDLERVKRALNHSNDSVTLIYAMADSLVRDGQLRRASGARRRR